MFRKFIFLITIFISPSLFAFSIVKTEDFSLSLKGYYKNLSLASRETINGDPYFGNLNRLRLDFDSQFLKYFSVKLIWDNEWIGGDWVNTLEFDTRQALRDSEFFNLNWPLVEKKNFYYQQDLYRVYLKFDPGFLSLIFGRQKIDWGAAHLFSPSDLFTPLTLFDVEKEEKLGVDAANLLIPIGSSAKLNLIYTVQDDIDKSRTALRFTKTVKHFDVSVYGGRFLQDVIFGADTSGEIGGMGIRGEVSYNVAEYGPNFAQLALEVDYGFANSFYVLGGYFYNGQAPNQQIPFFNFLNNSAQPIQTQYQHFLDTQLSYDITPLWKTNLVIVYDLLGTSFFINPEMSYSVTSWFDLSGGAQLAAGRSQGEFGQFRNLYYLEARLSF